MKCDARYQPRTFKLSALPPTRPSPTMSQLPVPPELPDEINDVNLLQWVSNTALQEPDPALHRQMDLPVLFASGIAAWFKTEIDVRIMMYHDPATMLVNFKRCSCHGGHNESPSPLSLQPPTLLGSRALRVRFTPLPTRSNRTQTFPIT